MSVKQYNSGATMLPYVLWAILVDVDAESGFGFSSPWGRQVRVERFPLTIVLMEGAEDKSNGP
jgi:hypothetical protein